MPSHCPAALRVRCASLGNAVDVVITRVMDLIMAVPSLVLAILVVAVLGPSLTNTIVAVTVVYLPRYVRLVRASSRLRSLRRPRSLPRPRSLRVWCSRSGWSTSSFRQSCRSER